MGYASYLEWAIPEQRVFLDPRVELFPLTMWQEYIEISNGLDIPELLDKYGVDRVLSSRDLQPKLAQALADSSGWSLEYEDAYAQLWRRT